MIIAAFLSHSLNLFSSHRHTLGSHYQIGFQVILFGRVVLFFKISCLSWLQNVIVHQFLLCNYGAKKNSFSAAMVSDWLIK